MPIEHFRTLVAVLVMNGHIVALCCLVVAPKNECWYDAALGPVMGNRGLCACSLRPSVSASLHRRPSPLCKTAN